MRFLHWATRGRLATLTRGRPWIPLAIFLVLALLVGGRAVRLVPHLDNWAKNSAYERVDYWIASSECTVKSGALLAACDPERGLTGIENVSWLDDRGHTLLANVFALVTGRAIDRYALTAANLVLNAAGLVTVALVLFLFGWKLSALLVLLLGRTAVVPGPIPGPDATAAYIAAFCFSLAGVLLLVFVPLTGSRKSIARFLIILVVTTVLFAVATLLRQPFGIAAFGVASLILMIRLLNLHRNSHQERGTAAWRTIAVAGCLIVATFFPTQLLIAARHALYGIPRGDIVLEHGIGHNLYMGLAAPGNPWGIKWDDIEAHKAATTIGKAPYASSEHFANLRQLYFRAVISDPLAALKIYQRKVWDSLVAINNASASSLALAALEFAVLLGAWLSLRGWRSHEETLVLVACWTLFGMVILQGVLAQPFLHFISPGEIAANVGFVVLLEAIVRRGTRLINQRFASSP